MTPAEQGAAIVGGSDLSFGPWATNPVGVLGLIVGRAADSVFAPSRGVSPVVMGERRARARHLTHLASWIVAQPGSPQPRGAVLDELVKRFGDGL